MKLYELERNVIYTCTAGDGKTFLTGDEVIIKGMTDGATTVFVRNGSQTGFADFQDVLKRRGEKEAEFEKAQTTETL